MGSAEITALRNMVDKVSEGQSRPAAIKDSVVEGDQVQTKAGSLAELTFSDKSIARMGANSLFTYNSQERLVKIDKGTVLMHTPAGNGGATITSGGVTGAISGTTFLLTATPAKCPDCSKELAIGKDSKVACPTHPSIQPSGTGGFALVVLEGKNVTKVTGPNGITVEIMPGQMTVVGSSSSGPPKVFAVNLAQILRSSPLIQAFPEPLPSFGAMQQTAILQQSSGALKITGATGLAISADGDILVGPSKPPSPVKPSFEMAINVPGGSGQNNSQSANDANDNIDTAAGGDSGTGASGTASNLAGGGGSGGGQVPGTPNNNNNSQNGTSANPNNNLNTNPNNREPNPTAVTVTGPATLVAGQLATFNVNLDAVAAQDTVISLNTDARLGGAPATVTVPRGSKTANFTALVPSAGVHFATGLATVTASSGLLTPGSFSQNLTPTALPGGSFPAALPGGTASTSINLNGTPLNLKTAQDLSLNNLAVTRMGSGLQVESSGNLSIANSTFDGWMQRSSGPMTLDGLGMGTMQFTETAAVAVDKPVMGIKMSSLPGGDMFLGDYRVTVSHYPTGTPGSPNDKTVDFLNRTASASDPIGYGSAANGANLALRDGAANSVNTIDYNSFTTASGEYQPDSPASGLNAGSATGTWNTLVSNESLNPNGQVDEVKLKYQQSKAVIRGAQGVEIVNVRFEGMDEIEVDADSLGGRVLMSGTLVSDPTISKLAMRALTSAEKSVLTGAGMNSAMEAVTAEINRPNFTGKTDVTIAGDRALQIAAINVAGQLSLNSHTIVFNNANVTSAGVIDARTRDGMVNRTYDTVVPGTVSFMGASGNNFLNTANGASMTIGSSTAINNAFNAGKLTDFGSVGTGTVMSVGKR